MRLNLEAVTIPFPLRLTRCCIHEGVNLSGAETRLLSFAGSVSGSITGDQLVVEGTLFLNDGFRAEGEVHLSGARITGDLNCTKGEFLSPSGVALDAESIAVGEAALLGDGLRVTGAVRLNRARINGILDCRGGKFRNPGGIALDAESIAVADAALLSHGFLAKGMVNFTNGNIGAKLEFTQAIFRGEPLNGLAAHTFTITGLFEWQEVSTTEKTMLDLSRAKAGGLADDESSWPAPGMLNLDGFVYGDIIDGPRNARSRLHWLGRQSSPRFRPQPYQQLAKVLRESGQEREAARILMSREDARRRFGDMGQWERYQHRLLGFTVGYAYRPYRVLILVLFYSFLVLQRGFEMWCNSAHQPGMAGGQHERTARDHAKDGLDDPRY
jgi:hypothetical protein